jgi:hypothetical protein
MLMMVPPMAAYARDSARVENRGPSTTTIVPPSTAAMPCCCAAFRVVARPVGQYGSAKFTWTAPVS